MEDLKEQLRRMYIKNRSVGFDGAPKDAVDENGEVGGNCPKCGRYEIELDRFGYCRDERCKHKRYIEAVKMGSVQRLSDGTIIWLHDEVK